jgi:hypothetical protein
MTSRSYDYDDQTYEGHWKYTLIKGIMPSDSTATQVARRRSGFYYGRQTANYNRKVKSGQLLPLNPYEKFSYEALGGLYRQTGKFTSAANEYTSSGLHAYLPTYGSVSVVDARLLAKEIFQDADLTTLLQQAYANSAPDLDLLTTLAELGKTVALVKGFRERLVKLILQARRGGLTSAAQAVGNAWLEWRYGWRLLGYDIAAVANTLEQPFRDNILTGRAGISKVDQKEYSDHTVNYFRDEEIIHKVTVDASLRVSVALQTASREANFSASLASTTWELIPFSFIADWFVSIGTAISAYNAYSSSLKQLASLSYKVTETVERSVGTVTVGTGTYATAPCSCVGTSSSKMTYLARRPISPAPSFVPQISVGLDWSTIADLSAILINLGKVSRT